jgi:2-haloacid dehalogenase
MGRSVVFDLGGVLVDWDPRYLLRQVMAGREEEMEWLLSEVLDHEWHLARDRGDSWPTAIDTLVSAHPEYTDVFRAYDERWAETMAGEHRATVAVLADLREAGVPLYALTNWAAHTFHHAEERFAWLDWFEGIVVSGRVNLVKPDPAIFHHVLDAFGLIGAETFFTDDHEPNVIAAHAVGIDAHLFTSAAALREELVTGGYLPGP